MGWMRRLPIPGPGKLMSDLRAPKDLRGLEIVGVILEKK
jgi:hypothetical protein